MLVGILTFYRPINHGAVLQACATNNIVLRKLGIDSEIIDYRFSRIELYRKPISIKRILLQHRLREKIECLLKDTIKLPFRIKENRIYDSFIKKYFTLSNRKYFNIEELETNCQGYDAYLVGSDLIWNPTMTDGFDPAFFLSFVKKKGVKKIAYAPSVGITDLTDEEVNNLKKYLVYLDYISVREKSTALQFQNLTDKEIYPVLDPTLLTYEKDWEKFYSTKPIYEKRYIFAFMVEDSDVLVNAVNSLAKEYGCEIVAYGSHFAYKASKVTYLRFSFGPSEFLNVIKNAFSVVTNSYHGCAFSLIFQKDFYCIPHTLRGIRMIDLMASFKLENRIVATSTFMVQPPIDYKTVNTLRNTLIKESYKYLKKALLSC